MKLHLKLPSKKPHTIGKYACESCLLERVQLLLEEGSKANMRQIPLSSGTIQRRISDMPERCERSGDK